ncbi:hypothetical protein MKW92_037413 [Papaver armeniacum]|nr:hypothetical protein MKW92_037413 [Papaver armeniacum]
MAVLRSGRNSSSSSNSQSLRSSDPALGGSRRLRSVLPTRPSKYPKPIKGCTTKERHDGGTKYELVEPGFLTTVYIGKCILHHTDFTEMFFAELTTIRAVRCVKFCKCMGPKDSISGDKNNGCLYCNTHNVQHPRDGGFKTGRVEV